MTIQTPDIPGLIDTKREEEGDWLEHAPDPEIGGKTGPNQIPGYRHLLLDEEGNGFRRVKVRSRHTKEYQRAVDSAQNEMARMRPKARRKYERVLADRLAAEHCIVDWDFTQRDGTPIPLTDDMSRAIMVGPEDQEGRPLPNPFRRHREFIILAIATLQGDIDQVAEEDQGNF